ncbi:MAG: SpoVR family protein [Deltaproteobacteria bacterium]|nr:SpoVR family protein [Deltaproteobacteria bacterium]
MSLPRYLAELQQTIEGYAREFELDFFDTIFEVLPYDAINMVAAYGGFPTRYPHWRFGMEYEQLKKSYAYGLSKIYEMVINNDPCYAYLLEGNSLVEQKTVMAHVYAHCDFFKNNVWFRDTNRKMMNEMANHGTRVRRYMAKHGVDEVENFIDTCLSVDNLIDIHAPMVRRRPVAPDEPLAGEGEARASDAVARLPVPRRYLDPYINPADYIDKQKQKLIEERGKASRFPPQPERDVLLFLMEQAPLNRWQRDLMGIIREEAYYFAPQGQTKILNEGWAVYWHSTIMTHRAMTDAEVIDYADNNAGILGTRPGSLNPYKIGLELFRYIEHKWNTGRFGPEYDACDNMKHKHNWDQQLGLGRKKIFEVRSLHNDVTFIDEYLDEEFCLEQKMFGYDYNPRAHHWEITTRNYKEIKNKLLFQLTNFGQPIIEVVDSNHANRGELLLLHRHEGVDIKLDWAQSTMEALYRIWTRPVLLQTIVGEKVTVLRHDGTEHTAEQIAPADAVT